MSINTEAAELLHAVADLYECGALKWICATDEDDRVSIVEALKFQSQHIGGFNPLLSAVSALADEAIDIYMWQRTPGRNTRHVISLLRKAAQRLEQA